MLTKSRGKSLEDISHVHIVSLMYKLITSNRDGVDLSIGFDRDRGGKQRELTNDKNVKGNYHVRNMLKDVLGFAEHQQKAIYGVGYKLPLTRNVDNAVLNKADATVVFKIKIFCIEWFVPHCTPSISNQAVLPTQT